MTINAKDIIVKATSGGTLTQLDDVPNQFTFTDQTNVATSTLITSDQIQVTGMDLLATAPISVDIGEYQINGGLWTSAVGEVSVLDLVRVRHTSSSSSSTPTNQTLTIGGIQDTFTSTTQAAAQGDISTTLQTSVTQYGIRWNFDQAYPVGQFVTGDYFVVGSPTITSIDGVDGETYQLSAKEYGKNEAGQRGQGFNAAGGLYIPSSTWSPPGVCVPGESLISTTQPRTNIELNSSISSTVLIETAAVLTFLTASPPVGSLRPAFVGNDRTIHNISEIDMNKLPNYSRPSDPTYWTGIASGPIEYYERLVERPYIEYPVRDFNSRWNTAITTSPFYHAEKGEVLNVIPTLLCADWTGLDKTDKSTLAYRYCQNALDFYYASLSARNDGDAFNVSSGVWGGQLVFCGYLMGFNAMLTFGHVGGRDSKFSYSDEISPTPASAIIPAGQTWVNWTHPRNGRYIDMAKDSTRHEHMAPSEWDAEQVTDESYRGNQDVHPHVGVWTGIMLMSKANAVDLRQHLGRVAMADYVDRWMNEDLNNQIFAPTGQTYRQEIINAGFSGGQYGGSGSTYINIFETTFPAIMYNAHRGTLD